VGIAVGDMVTIRHVLDELGQALNSFSEAGLRHRHLWPRTLLVRSGEPLDLLISGLGSARLSEFDLDIVSLLETTRYMAPEAISGDVAAASNWWSLGMILLTGISGWAAKPLLQIAQQKMANSLPRLVGKRKVYQGILPSCEEI
jgi:serine/threonine protein kinase